MATAQFQSLGGWRGFNKHPILQGAALFEQTLPDSLLCSESNVAEACMRAHPSTFSAFKIQMSSMGLSCICSIAWVQSGTKHARAASFNTHKRLSIRGSYASLSRTSLLSALVVSTRTSSMCSASCMNQRAWRQSSSGWNNSGAGKSCGDEQTQHTHSTAGSRHNTARCRGACRDEPSGRHHGKPCTSFVGGLAIRSVSSPPVSGTSLTNTSSDLFGCRNVGGVVNYFSAFAIFCSRLVLPPSGKNCSKRAQNGG